MTEQRIKELRGLCERATPGEWMYCLGSGYHECTAIKAEAVNGESQFIADFLPDYALGQQVDKLRDIKKDMDFVVAARTVLPELLDEIDAKDKEITRLNAEIVRLTAELAAMTRERDAAVKYLEKEEVCEACIRYDEGLCFPSHMPCKGFKWRGPVAAEGENE